MAFIHQQEIIMARISIFKEDLIQNNNRQKYLLYWDGLQGRECYKEVRDRAAVDANMARLNSIPQIDRIRLTPFRPKRAHKTP